MTIPDDRDAPTGLPGVVERDGVPLHHQLSSVLRAAIRSGRYNPGDLLPGEHELCRLYSVSRATVRRALQTLEHERIVDRQPGRGTVVLALRGSIASGSIGEHLTAIQRNADKSQVEVVSVDDVRASRGAANALHLDAHAIVRRIVRIRRSGRVPLRYMTTEVPLSYGSAMTRSLLATSTVVEALRLAGHPVQRTEDEVGATLADPVTAEALGVRIGDPLLEISRTMYDDNRTPIAHQWTVASPDVWRIRITLAE